METTEHLKKVAILQNDGNADIAVQKLIEMGELDAVCDIFKDIDQKNNAALYLRESGKTTPRVDRLLLEHVKSRNHRIDGDEERTGRDVQTPLCLKFLADKYGVSINDGRLERVQSKRILLVEAAVNRLETVIPSGLQAPTATPTDGKTPVNPDTGTKDAVKPAVASTVISPPAGQKFTSPTKNWWPALIGAIMVLIAGLVWRRNRNERGD